MGNNYRFWWGVLPAKELPQVYASMVLRSFALSLVSVFVPLYLYIERGFSLEQTLLFFIFYAVVLALSSPLAAKFSARYGVKHSVLVSVPLYLLFLSLLYFLPFFPVPLWIISSIFGLSIAFYWRGTHLVFMHASDHKHRGEEIGKRIAFSIAATISGPFLGGLLIKFVGFPAVFGLAALTLIFSAIILFHSQEDHVPYSFSLRSLVDRKHWQNALYFASEGMRAIAGGVIWPLLVFLILKDYLSLGFLESVLAGISALLVWLMRKYSDHTNKRKVIFWTSGLEALAWIFRALVSSVGQVFGATIFGAISSGLFSSPVEAREYDKAKGDIAAYFVSREIFINLGRIFLLTFVLLANSLSGGLIFTGLATLTAWLF